jgi:hypothetical protein
MSLERKTLKVFLRAQLTRMRQLVTFSKLSNDVSTTGTGSMHVVASRIAISYSCPASFLECNMDVNLLHGKAFGSRATN